MTDNNAVLDRFAGLAAPVPPRRRRSSYGLYVATGLIGSGGELETGRCACCDEARDSLDVNAADTYRRTVMRHLMRTATPPLRRQIKPSARGRARPGRRRRG